MATAQGELKNDDSTSLPLCWSATFAKAVVDIKCELALLNGDVGAAHLDFSLSCSWASATPGSSFASHRSTRTHPPTSPNTRLEAEGLAFGRDAAPIEPDTIFPQHQGQCGIPGYTTGQADDCPAGAHSSTNKVFLTLSRAPNTAAWARPHTCIPCNANARAAPARTRKSLHRPCAARAFELIAGTAGELRHAHAARATRLREHTGTCVPMHDQSNSCRPSAVMHPPS